MVRAWLDTLQVVRLALEVDGKRALSGPADLVRSLRLRGLHGALRGKRARARLQRTIRFVDRFFPSGPNCYRRALVEIAMDAGAAAEPLHMGLQAEGGLNSGHAWLESAPDPSRSYDAEFVV